MCATPARPPPCDQGLGSWVPVRVTDHLCQRVVGAALVKLLYVGAQHETMQPVSAQGRKVLRRRLAPNEALVWHEVEDTARIFASLDCSDGCVHHAPNKHAPRTVRCAMQSVETSGDHVGCRVEIKLAQAIYAAILAEMHRAKRDTRLVGAVHA